MLRFINDKSGMMGLTLSQLGLFLATGILLAAVFSVIYHNEWQRTSEIRSLGSSFSSIIQDMDRMFFEQTTIFHFPHKNYVYEAHISSQYIVMYTKGFSNNNIIVTERFLISIWPRTSNGNWTTCNELHGYLKGKFGNDGTKDDPLFAESYTVLCQEYNESIAFYALHPLKIITNEPIYLQKVTIYSQNDKKHDFVLVYQ